MNILKQFSFVYIIYIEELILIILAIFIIHMFYPSMIKPISFGQNAKLSIFHINDLHGQIDNVSSICLASKKFDSLDNQNVDRIKLSGGDNICGNDHKKNQMVSYLLNVLGITASSVGNHEFDGGAQALSDFQKNTKTKFLSANLNIPENSPNEHIQSSTVKEINGTKYGIIGLTTIELPTSVRHPELLGGAEIQNLEETINSVQKEVNTMKENGVQRIILLPHMGYELDKEVARKTTGIDVIVSGHSHDIIEKTVSGENYVFSKTNEPVLIVQAGDNGRYYGVCDIEFDENGVIKKATNNLYKTENKKSPLINHLIDSTLGKSPVIANVSKTVENPKNRRIEANGWSNIIVDSMTAELGVDIALINAANIRKVPALGNLTERMVTETTPYGNKLVKTTITEAELVEALKFACKSITHPSGNPGLLLPSNLKFDVDKDGNLMNLRYSKGGIEQKIDIENPTDKVYSIVIDEFLFKNEEYKPLNLKYDYEIFDFDKDKTAIDYIKKLTNNGEKPLEIKDDGRVRILKTSQDHSQSNNKQSFLGLTSLRNS